MNDTVSRPIDKDKPVYLFALGLFLVLSAWYFYIHNFDLNISEHARQAWGSVYQIVAFFGGVMGMHISRKWGGLRSLIGKAMFYFSLGLLLQCVGQSVDSYYNFFRNEVIPYPSLGDIGFMGSVIAYIAGAYSLLKATGVKYSFKSVKGKLFTILLPLVILIACYFFFLQGYQFDWSQPIKIVLDFGYPFGQALYVSLAILAFVMSQNFLGGIMKRPALFLILALVFQYISDFTFLYQANAGTWIVGGVNDYLYFASYFFMALALVYMGGVFKTIREA